MTETLNIAKWLREIGCSVIPIDHPAETTQTDPTKIGKVPVVESWKRYQAQPATVEELSGWFGNGHHRNLAAITGAVSKLVVVDLDSPEAVVWADAHLPPTPWRSRTSKGEHRGYRHPGTIVKNKVRLKTGDPAIKIDVRGDGGYVVVPGSVHATGVEYAWIDGMPPATSQLPVFDPAWLTSEPKVERTADSLTTTVPTGERNDTLFREGCRLRRQGFDEAEIAATLSALNVRRCQPPLGAREVEAIAQSCARYEPMADAYPTTEQGDAEFFAACFADRVRFDHRRGHYLLFDAHRWKQQTNGEVHRLALEAIRARQAAALKITSDSERDKRKQLLAWALRGEERRRQINLLALARNVIPLADAGDGWDMDAWLLGVPNGVLDLRTGTLRDGRPEDRITMAARTSFEPAARCPLWDATVADIFGGNAELIAYFDRYVGYSLTGDCREETLAFCCGEGANGKGTLMNTLAWLLGDYADDLPFSALELHAHGSGIPNDIAKIVGKRFVTSSETGETARLNEARVKALTGRDPITARFLHREFFTFQPVAKFWLATNEKPEVRDTSAGFWRRIHLIPFTQSFADKPDLKLKDKLRDELPGILARAVRGCLAWQRDGLNPPAVVVEATNDYRTDSLPLARFFADCCLLKANTRAQFGLLFDAYRRWSGESPERRLTRKEFGDELHSRFETDPNDRRNVVFLGIGLLDPSRAEER